MKEQIDHLMRKNPNYKKIFLKIIENDKKATYETVSEVYKNIINNKNILKQHKFNAAEYNTIEDMFDAVRHIVLQHKSRNYAKRLVSNKHLHLFNEETYKLFAILYEKNISKSSVRDLLVKKISRYNTSTEFNSDLKNVISAFSNHNMSDILSIVSKTDDAEVVVKDLERNILILSISSFLASKKLGSSSWCIASSENYWDNYFKEALFTGLYLDRTQLFVYDFEKAPTDPFSLIGITVAVSGHVSNSHLKNDQSFDLSKATEILTRYNLKFENRHEPSDIKELIIKAADKHSVLSLLTRYASPIDALEYFYHDLPKIDGVRQFTRDSVVKLKDDIFHYVKNAEEAIELLEPLYTMVSVHPEKNNTISSFFLSLSKKESIQIGEVLDSIKDKNILNDIKNIISQLSIYYPSIFNSDFKTDDLYYFYLNGFAPASSFNNLSMQKIVQKGLIENDFNEDYAGLNNQILLHLDFETVKKIFLKVKKVKSIKPIEAVLDSGFIMHIPYDNTISDILNTLDKDTLKALLDKFFTSKTPFYLEKYKENSLDSLKPVYQEFQ